MAHLDIGAAPLSEDEESVVSLEEAVGVVFRAIERGVRTPHAIPTAMLLSGLRLLEATCSRAAIAAWLYSMADFYASNEIKRPPQ